jgi:hypothetical protein
MNDIKNTSKYIKNDSDLFVCENCDFICSKKGDYNRHLMTSKHTNKSMISNDIKKTSKNIKIVLTCECGKQYLYSSGLWRHKKICYYNKENTISQTEVINEINTFTPNMFYELLKQNNELTKQVIELSSKTSITNNTTNNNNSFNLQFFLNETCKDALNITDFVNQLQVGIKDLEATGRLGYTEGISKIFINGLKQLDINQRPVHCSDSKRETIYIKDENIWEKEDVKHSKLTNAIKDVAHKNIQQIQVWTEKHPEHKDLSSKYNDKYMKLVSEAMPGSTREESDKNYKKIVTNIMKESLIEK